MAPNVTLHFFAANDISGSVVHTLTDEDPVFRGLTLKLDRSGLGGGELLLARAAGEDFDFPAESFVRILVAAYSTTDYYPWGLFLNKRLATVIDRDEDGGEVYRFGGAGPKMYLDRGRLGIGGPLSGWNVDLANGVWRWGNAATVGRILERIRAQDSNMDDPALGALTLNFDETDDSNGVAWTDTSLGSGDAPYTIPIGHSMLQSLYDFEDLIELSSWIDLGTVASPKYELNVIQGLGDDVTGSSFGAGVCLLQEGVNIANSGLTVEGHAIRKASHVIVEGADGAWVVVERLTFNPGDYVKYAKTEFPRTSQTNLLTKSGLRWLQRQDLGEREYTIDILPGMDDSQGAYFPAPDRVLWLSNEISLDTSAVGSTPTLLDIGPSTNQLVTGLELRLGEASDDSTDLKKARSWYVKVNLNRERAGTLQKTPDQRSASSGGGSCKCIQVCGTDAMVVTVGGTDDLEFGYLDGEGAQVPLYRRSTDGEVVPIVLESLQPLTTDLTYYIEDHTVAGVKLDTDPSSGDYTAVLITDQGNGYSLYEWDDLNTGLNRNDLHVLIPNEHSGRAAPCVHTHPEFWTLSEAVADQSHSQFDDGFIGRRFLIGAHGGDIGNNGDTGDSYPQNSLEAHRQAALKGADYADIDCRLTSDGVWVAWHDTSITAGSNGTGDVSAITAATFTAAEYDSTTVPGYNASRHGTSIGLATVQEIIDAVRPYGMGLQLDCKPTDDDAATSLAELVVANQFEERAYIHVQTLTQAAAVKAVSARIMVGADYTLSGATTDDNVDIISIAHTTLTSLSVATAIAPKVPSSNMPIALYGIESEEDHIQTVYDAGARMWTSNDLDGAFAQRGQIEAATVGYWEPVTNGDSTTPEIVFSDGDIVMTWVTE